MALGHRRRPSACVGVTLCTIFVTESSRRCDSRRRPVTLFVEDVIEGIKTSTSCLVKRVDHALSGISSTADDSVHRRASRFVQILLWKPAS
jgi:hypothetical protein